MNKKLDLNKIRELLGRCKWNWAKTYLSVPHEYIVRDKCELTDEEFLFIVEAQREFGIHERWGKYNFPYLYVDGYKYWTMGNSFDITKIINRQKVFSEFDLLETYKPCGMDKERRDVANIIKSTFKKPVFEAGFGDGWLINEGGFISSEWYGVEPSKKLVDYVRSKYVGFGKRISRMSFEEAIDKWKGTGYVVVALFGSASYIMEQYLKILKDSGTDFFLMFYREGYCPEQFNDMHHFCYQKKQLQRMFGCDVSEYGDYYIVSSKPMVKTETYMQTTLF